VSATEPPGERAAAPAVRGRLGLTIAVAAVVLAIDQLTKWWALERLVDGDVDVVWTLRFRLAFNSGMAFSQGRGLGPVIGVLGLVVVVVLVAVAAKNTTTLGAIAVGMIAGGAAGNIADRVFRSDDGFLQGRVVDFIDFQWWPVFNVADIGIVVGGILLVLSSWSGSRAPAS
jgi:signal peptidase II